MVEATDRPQGTGEQPGGAGEKLAPPPLASSETYQPLSLLALAGFGLAVLYGLIVVLGAVVALFNRMPWLMPGWTFLIPLAAIALSWAARNRVLNSEGTLSGLPFTTWGIGISAFIGLNYAAYYGSTYWAISQQADECARKFIGLLQDDRPDLAYLLTVRPIQPDDDSPELRDVLEVEHNAPGPRGRPGQYTSFRQSDYVVLITSAGKEAQVQPVSVTQWDHDQGGYLVYMKYHVRTPLAEFDLLVATFGRDSKPGEPKGRQWRIAMDKGGARIVSAEGSELLKMTSRGEELSQAAMTAQSFATVWQDKMSRQFWNEAYLDTLPPAERTQQGKVVEYGRFLLALPVTGLGPLGLADEAYQAYLKGRARYPENILQVDEKTFWAPKNERANILKTLREVSQSQNGPNRLSFTMMPVRLPGSRTGNGELSFLFDVQVQLMDDRAANPKYVLEGQLVVATDEKMATSKEPGWRVVKVNMLSGRNAPNPEVGRPGRPR
jgi:hypothetical protein